MTPLLVWQIGSVEHLILGKRTGSREGFLRETGLQGGTAACRGVAARDELCDSRPQAWAVLQQFSDLVARIGDRQPPANTSKTRLVTPLEQVLDQHLG